MHFCEVGERKCLKMNRESENGLKYLEREVRTPVLPSPHP